MTIAHIYRDPTLYGHALTSLHSQIAEVTTAQFSWADRLPADYTEHVLSECWWMREVTYIYREAAAEKRVSRAEFLMQSQIENYLRNPLIDLTEFVARRVLGLCATALATVTLAPLGLSMKMLHLCVRQVAPHPLTLKAIEIWNDSNLCGHRLTRAPAAIWNQMLAPLKWHLRADGTDRRVTSDAVVWMGAPVIHHQGEYRHVPFELCEGASRFLYMIPLVLATALCPLGFAAKCVDLAYRSCVRAG